MANEREINALQRKVGIEISTTGAESAASAIESVDNSLTELDRATRASGKSLRYLGTGFKSVLDSATKFAAISYGVQQVFNNLGINTSQKELANYNKELLKSSIQFSKYGESIFQVEKRILRIKDSFGFTRQEAIKLQSTFEKGFNYQNPNKMVKVMDTLYSIVGSNSEAMQEMVQNAASVGQVIPIYQELFNIGMSSQTAKAAVNARKTSKELLYAASLSGKISIGDFKTQLEAIAALENTSPAQKKALEERKKQVQILNDLKVLWEDITFRVAKMLTPTISKINDFLKEGGDKLERWAAIALTTAGAMAAIVASVGTVNAAVSIANLATGMSGGHRGGKLGSVASMMQDHGSHMANPTYVYVVGGMPLNGTSPVLMGAGKAGKVGRAGRLANVGSKALGAGMVIGGTAMAANYATNLGQNHFASAKSLDRSGPAGDALKRGGNIAGSALVGAGVGAAIGTFIAPGIGTAVGAAIGGASGAIMASAKTLGQSLYYVSDSMMKNRKKMNDHYDKMIANAETAQQGQYFQAIQDKNNLQNKAGDLEGKNANAWRGIFGNTKVGNLFGESDEKIAKIKGQADEINDSLKEMQALSEKSLALKEQNRELLNVTSKLALVEAYVQSINANYDASIDKLRSIAGIVKLTAGQGGAAGLAEASGGAFAAQDDKVLAAQRKYDAIKRITDEDFTKNISFETGNSEDVFNQLDASIGKSLSEEQLQKLSETTGRGEMALMLETMLAKAKAEQNQALAGYAEISEMIVESGRGAQDLAKSNSARIEADIALASNLAAGVSVSAQMRMENVQAIQSEIVAIENMITSAQGQLSQANKAIEKAKKDGNEDALNAALAQKVQMEMKVNGLVTERTQAMTKQAELTKVMRDGYIDAIAAMTTGAGMFTQITIDQNKNLGQLAAGTNNRVVGLRSGAMGRGLTSSERYTAGGIMSNGSRFGASDEVNNLITSSNPLASFDHVADDIGERVSSAGSSLMQIWQDKSGRFFSNMAAAMKDQRYGTSELQDMISNSPSSGSPVVPSGGSSSKKSSVIPGKVLEELHPTSPKPSFASSSNTEVGFSGGERTELVNAMAKEFSGLVIKALGISEDQIMSNLREMG